MPFYTYIATNDRNTVLYTGVTNNLERRIYEHKEKLVKGFTSRYNISKLVWFETFEDIRDAIECEKKIKGWTRQKKLNLIANENPEFKNLIL